MIARPVCVKCRIEMRCARNGFAVFHGGSNPKAFSRGDRYRCQGCGAEVVVGFGSECQAEGDVSAWRMKPITLRTFDPEDFPGPKQPAYDDGCP